MKFKNILKSIAFLTAMGTMTTVQALRNTFIDDSSSNDTLLFSSIIETNMKKSIDEAEKDGINNLITNIPSIIEQSMTTINEKHLHDASNPISEGKFHQAPESAIFHHILVSDKTTNTNLKIIFKQDSEQKYKLFTVTTLLMRFISKIGTLLSFNNHLSCKGYFYPKNNLERNQVITLVKTLINALKEKAPSLFPEIEAAAQEGIEQLLQDLQKEDTLYKTLHELINSDAFKKNYNSYYSILIFTQYAEASFPKNLNSKDTTELTNILSVFNIPQLSSNDAAKSIQKELDLFKRKTHNLKIALGTISPLLIFTMYCTCSSLNNAYITNKNNYKILQLEQNKLLEQQNYLNCSKDIASLYHNNCNNITDINSDIFKEMQSTMKTFCKSQKTNTDKNYEKNFKTYVNNKSPKPHFIGKYNCKF